MGVSAFLSSPALDLRRRPCQNAFIKHPREKIAALEPSTRRVLRAPSECGIVKMPCLSQCLLRASPTLHMSMEGAPPDKRPFSPMGVTDMASDMTEKEDSMLALEAADAQERLTASANLLSAAKRDYETVDAWVTKLIDENNFAGPVAAAGLLRLQRRTSALEEAQKARDDDKNKLAEIIQRQQGRASIKEMSRKLTGPSPLGTLPASTVAGRLRAFIEPTPKFESGLLRRFFGPNLTGVAVNELHVTRTNLRAAAYISGSSGRGKTLCELLLLLATLPQYQALLPGLTADQVAWWQEMPIFIASFNGLTKANMLDHLLAAIDPSLPFKLRLIFTESHDPAFADFFAYYNRVVDMFESGVVSVAGVDAAVAALMNARLSAGASREMRAVLLVDELPKLSLSTLTTEEKERFSLRLVQLRAGVQAQRTATSATADQVPATADEVLEANAVAGVLPVANGSSINAAGSLSSVAVLSPGAKTSGLEQAHKSSGAEWEAAEAAGASTAASLGAFEAECASSGAVGAAAKVEAEVASAGAVSEISDLQPEDVANATAESVRKSICDWCETLRIRPVITAFDPRFVRRQASALTGSLSTVLPLVSIPFLPLDEVENEATRRLTFLSVSLRPTSAAGQRECVPADVVAKHCTLLTVGHPRAVQTLFGALETSADGDVFFMKILDVLSPERLSVAQESINILAQNPLVMAVGLLNFQAPTTGIISERLSWDSVIGQAALFLEYGKRPTIILSFFFAALQTRLRQLARLAPSPKEDAPPTPTLAGFDNSGSDAADAASLLNIKDTVVGTIHDVCGDDCGLYSACLEVRSALLNGDVPIAWEGFVLWSEVVTSRCRALLVRYSSTVLATTPPQYQNFTVAKLYPVPSRLSGTAEWLHDAVLDASIARRGVKFFTSVPQLFSHYPESHLERHVWRPRRCNFPGIDGIMFIRCVQAGGSGPRRNQLVAVAVQYKAGDLVFKDDIQEPCTKLSQLFGDEVWALWQDRTALVVVTRKRAPPLLNLRERSLALDSCIVVDKDSFGEVYGSTAGTVAVCADSLFGTQIVR